MAGDLYELLSLAPHVGVDMLRARYEGAMTAATRAEDWRRARELSQAFDRLPASVRLAVYPGRDRNAGRFAHVAAPTTPRRGSARRAERHASSATLYQCTGMRKPFRVASYAVAVLMLFGASVGLLEADGLIHWNQRDPVPQRQFLPSAPTQPQLSVVVPAAPITHIAPNLATGPDGMIVVICPAGAEGGGTLMRVAPGTHVDCADGAAPEFAPGT